MSIAPARRNPGPDVVRALAILGVVVMNYHGYLINAGARRDGSPAPVYDLFDPWMGPLATRFAATFVVTAGIGVSLMTRSRRPGVSGVLARRGLLLYVAGLAFDEIWRGTILPYYGAMFLLAAALWRLPSRWLLGIAAGAALAGFGLRWLTDPGGLGGLAIDVLVNGTHPLLPWLTFFCVGMVIGRLLDRAWWRTAAAAAGVALFSLASMLALAATGPRGTVLLGSDPWSRSLVYTASALGTALLAVAGITWLAERYAESTAIDFLRRAGQMSLTIYIAHALVFNLLVDWADVIEPDGIATALGFALVYWVLALLAAVAYQRRFGRGPVERVYRAITG